MANTFIGEIQLDTTQAQQSLGSIATKAGEARQSIEQFGNDSTEAVRDFSESIESASNSMGGLHEVVGELQRMNLKQTLGDLKGAFNDLATAIEQPATNARDLVEQMLALGASGAEVGAMFGPQGALVGAIVGATIPAITSLIQSVNNEAEAHDRAAHSVDSQVASYDTLLERIRQYNSLQNQQSTLALGLGSLEEQQANLAAVEASLANINAAAIEYGRREASPENDVALAALIDARRRLEAEAQSAREALELARVDQALLEEDFMNGGGDGDSGSSRRRGGRATPRASASRVSLGPAPGENLFEEIDTAEEILEQFEGVGERFDVIIGSISSGFDEIIERGARSAEVFYELQDAAKESADTFRDSWTGSVDDVIEAFDRANEAAKNAGRTQISQGRLMEQAAKSVGNTVLESVGEDVTRAFAASIAAAISGAESFEKVLAKMVQGILNSLLQEAIVQTVREIALGISDTASYKYDSAAAHFAAAAAWGAVGVAAGVGLGAVSAASGGGSASPSAAATASPAPVEERETKPTTYNIYYSNPLFQNRDEQLKLFRQLETESARRR